MIDTSCRKCKAPKPPTQPITEGPFSWVPFKVTGYRCESCGHWNELKRRKDKEARK